MAGGSPRRKGRFGYDGCLLDLGALLVVLLLAYWGLVRWNNWGHRPFGLPKIPVPHVKKMISAEWQRLRHRDGAPPAAPAATPHVSSTPSPRAATPSPSPAASTPSPAAPAASQAPSAPTPAPTMTPTSAGAATPDGVTSPSPAATAGGAVGATIRTVAAQVRASNDPLSAAATALCRSGRKMYLGLPEGGIAIADTTSRKGIAVRLPRPEGPVRTLTVAGDGVVWWLTGERLYAFLPATRIVRAYDVTGGVSAYTAVAALPSAAGADTIALLGTGSALFLDAATGTARDPGTVLPETAAAAASHPETTLFLATDPGQSGRTTLLEVSGDGVTPGTPANVSLWTAADLHRTDAWKAVAVDGFTVPAFSTLRLQDAGRAAVALAPSSVALLAKPSGGQTLAAGTAWTGAWNAAGTGSVELRPVSAVPDGVYGLWAPPERIALGKTGLWWVFAGRIFHQTLPGSGAGGGVPEAYLPWNGAGSKVAALVADDTGVWAATERGVRHIVPGHPVATAGYDGYVRARLGSDAVRPPSVPSVQKLAAAIPAWQGVPYRWGGDSKAGIDCSGYVSALYQSIGVSVPRATTELANGAEGKRVTDDLKYGDVLVFPGHCALYIGDGWTTEAMDTGVGKAAIWSRQNVVVRRFLHL